MWAVENMLLHPESSMVCVDVWITWPEYDGRTNYNYEEVFDANVKGLTQVSKRKGPSKEVLPTLPAGSFHGCYIDGSHDEEDVLSDARLALPLMKPGAVMVFDDYEWPMGPGVKRAVDALLVEWASKVQVRHIGYQAVVQVNP